MDDETGTEVMKLMSTNEYQYGTGRGKFGK